MHVLSFFVLGKASIYMFNNYNLINFSLLKRGVVHVILKWLFMNVLSIDIDNALKF